MIQVQSHTSRCFSAVDLLRSTHADARQQVVAADIIILSDSLL